MSHAHFFILLGCEFHQHERLKSIGPSLTCNSRGLAFFPSPPSATCLPVFKVDELRPSAPYIPKKSSCLFSLYFFGSRPELHLAVFCVRAVVVMTTGPARTEMISAPSSLVQLPARFQFYVSRSSLSVRCALSVSFLLVNF